MVSFQYPFEDAKGFSGRFFAAAHWRRRRDPLCLRGIYFFALRCIQIPKFLNFLMSRLERFLDVEVYHIPIRLSLIIIMVSSLASTLSFLFLGFQRFVFFVPNTYLFSNLGTLEAILIGWVFLISLKVLILDLIANRKTSRPVSLPVRSWLYPRQLRYLWLCILCYGMQSNRKLCRKSCRDSALIL